MMTDIGNISQRMIAIQLQFIKYNQHRMNRYKNKHSMPVICCGCGKYVIANCLKIPEGTYDEAVACDHAICVSCTGEWCFPKNSIKCCRYPCSCGGTKHVKDPNCDKCSICDSFLCTKCVKIPDLEHVNVECPYYDNNVVCVRCYETVVAMQYKDNSKYRCRCWIPFDGCIMCSRLVSNKCEQCGIKICTLGKCAERKRHHSHMDTRRGYSITVCDDSPNMRSIMCDKCPANCIACGRDTLKKDRHMMSKHVDVVLCSDCYYCSCGGKMMISRFLQIQCIKCEKVLH